MCNAYLNLVWVYDKAATAVGMVMYGLLCKAESESVSFSGKWDFSKYGFLHVLSLL